MDSRKRRQRFSFTLDHLPGSLSQAMLDVVLGCPSHHLGSFNCSLCDSLIVVEVYGWA